jgi:hypothetical protein
VTDDIDAKIAELREVTREANQVLRDMGQVLKDFEQAVAEARRVSAKEIADWRKDYEARMKAEWKQGLDNYHAQLAKAIEVAEASINNRMDTIATMITKPYDTPRGPMSIEEIVALKTGNAIEVPMAVDLESQGLPPRMQRRKKR